ncbi:hypothetical protein JCM10207_004723 [Rhodosporidiobolus poonsookiae]
MPVTVNDVTAVALVDSGSQADLLSSSLAHRLGLPFRRLLAPLHADLGTDNLSTRLSIYAEASLHAGDFPATTRSFFVAPLPPGIDLILGVPWLTSSKTAVSASKVFVVPNGPSEDVYDFAQGRFAFQPQRNFDSLGFTQLPMTLEQMHGFAFCALLSGVEGLDDFVDFEPPNPLLNIDDDDPSLPDLSPSEAADGVRALVESFTDVLVSELPDRLPPNRPEQHSIDLIDPERKIRPKTVPIPARYDKQWRAHVLKFVETGYWAPEALDSACFMFAVPKHDPSQGRFVINLHFKNAYEQIRLDADSVPLSGFVTPTGTYVSRVMQQGDTNAPNTMHRVCAMMFSAAIGRFLEVFYDDVFIYSRTRRAHLCYLKIVLTTLLHYRFYLSKDKVEFLAPVVKALGCIIDDDGIHVDPEQWDAVKNWPTPRNKKDILRFCGSVDWHWSPACDAAFGYVKSLVPQTLVPLDFSKLEDGSEKLFIHSDASILGCGSWIGQGATRETARPFRYHSAKFNSAQRNYHTTDQELLGVLDACLSFKDLILGWDVVVVTDHMALRTYWDQPPKLTRQHVRLWETLSQFSLAWAFIPGKENALATDSFTAKILANPAAFPSFSVHSDLLFRLHDDTAQLVLPAGRVASSPSSDRASPSFVEYAVSGAHLALGHLGAAKTLTYLRRAYWWPTMHKDVHDFVRQCEVCSRNKSSTAKPFGLLHPLDSPSRPWQAAGMDFVVGLPGVLFNGELVDSILSVTDLFSKMVVLIPLPSTATAADVATRFFAQVYCRFGRLDSITDGRSEVTNKAVGQILRSICEDCPEDWASKVATAEFALNSASSAATSLSPFEILYGFLPSSLPVSAWAAAPQAGDDASSRAERARMDWLRVSDALIASRVEMVHHANKRRRADSPHFLPGNLVYVSTAGMRFLHALSGKFIPKFVGPFPIIAVNPDKSTVDIDFPAHLRVHPRIHTSKLRPHHPNDDERFPSRSLASPPPPIPAANGADEWLVEKLVADRVVRGKREFKVRYLGYSAAADEWRPEAELRDTAPDFLAEYLALIAARRGGSKTKKASKATVHTTPTRDGQGGLRRPTEVELG